jgi:hypothetical protein
VREPVTLLERQDISQLARLQSGIALLRKRVEAWEPGFRRPSPTTVALPSTVGSEGIFAAFSPNSSSSRPKT